MGTAPGHTPLQEGHDTHQAGDRHTHHASGIVFPTTITPWFAISIAALPVSARAILSPS